MEKTLRNGDKLTFDADKRRVTVERKDGRFYNIASYDNAHQSHRRGAFTVGDISNFHLPRLTVVHVLKFFYPDDSLRYLTKYGYIAS